MYIPATFAETETSTLHAFMRDHAFGTLVTQGASGLVASHLPLLLDAEAGQLGLIFGHMARANPQWRHAGSEALAVFSGPHAYVSPAWYAEGGTVPTWNYVAVHAYGPLELVEDRAELIDILRTSVSTFEGPRPDPWRFDEREPHVDTMLKAIVGFRIPVARLEGKWKLSQNQPIERRRRVARALGERTDADSLAIAALMNERLARAGGGSAGS